MHAIPSGPFTNVTSLPGAPAIAPLEAASHGGGDHLADMRPSMDAAERAGRPLDADGAAAVLATGSSYLQGATSTLQRLDDGIARRTRSIDAMRSADPASVADAERQLEMLRRLRDRVQLSIERVSDILAGTDRPDIGVGPAASDRDRQAMRADRRQEDLEALQQRHALLAPGIGNPVAEISPSTVAGTYTQEAPGPR